MSPSITNTMKRFSRGSANRNSGNSSNNGQQLPQNTGGYTPPQQHNTAGGIGLHDPQQQHHNSRPVSASSDASFEHMNRPTSQQYNQGASAVPTGANPAVGGGMSSSLASGAGHHVPVPHSAIGGLSRTDQVVLRYFWEEKYLDNAKRDLHFLKFPFFPQYPAHTDLMPYCEIYHLVKTTPGATIISLGSANGVYIGFELAQGAQLHIDMDDEWRDISHHRVIFKPYDSMLRDPASDVHFKSWPKPLTIEFLEEQYRAWMRDLTSFCWIDEAVRDLGGEAGPGVGEEAVAPQGHLGGGSLGQGGPGMGRGAGGLEGKGSRGEL